MNGRESTSTAIPSTKDSETGALKPAISGRVTSDKINEALETISQTQQEQLQARYLEINRKQNELSQKQKELYKNQEKQTKDLKEEIDKLKSESKDSAFRMIEVVGIFTALLGFIVFEAQIFKATQSTLTLVGLTFVMLGALIFFVLLLDLAFDGFKTTGKLRAGLFIAALTCMGSGFVSAYFGYQNGDYNLYLTEEEVIAEIDKRINESQNATTTTIIQKDDTELLEFKNCILKSGLARCL